jgi:Acetyltransferase (GNAT) domain
MFLCSDVESFKTAVPNCSARGDYIAFRPRGQSANFHAEATALGVEIRFAEALTDGERQALFGWGENIFGIEDAGYSWRPKDYHFITEEAGRPLSHVGVIKTTVRAGETAVTVGGVGGVVTLPEAQGRRLVHEAMRQASDFICQELGAEFGMLFCLPRLAPFYARQGWRMVEEEIEIEQPAGKVAWPYHVMVRPCGGRAWPAGKIEVGGLPW